MFHAAQRPPTCLGGESSSLTEGPRMVGAEAEPVETRASHLSLEQGHWSCCARHTWGLWSPLYLGTELSLKHSREGS